ncbi:MAG: hypothetical protein HOU81_11390 [Hamadaea sp.]|uniref:hypothetical protein n=1 Tax=Hamadaea sp. TaxID=2024425 RepID=UPI0017EEA1EB|nr:hypothetical protein [Hamadaea sp.]NUR71416.1 hypothetical protein [Hamadaea sp.]NUT23726.1 hypothetical protein [Hamadaea sp.]
MKPFERTATLVAAVLLSLVTAACAGGSAQDTGSAATPSATPRPAGSPSRIAFSHCMRTHGVPNFPDPDSKGNYQATGPGALGVSSTQYEAAEQACLSQLPTGGSLEEQTNQCLWFGACPPALLQQLMNIERQYAECIRTHGVPNWPDPEINKGNRPAFNLSKAGIDPDSMGTARFEALDRDCRSRLGGSVPKLPTS